MKSHLILRLSIFLLFFAAKPVFSQYDEKSTLIGNPGDNESANTICSDPAGNIYLGGRSNAKGLVIKQNALHVTQWIKTFRFTSNPADEVSIGFMDVIGDTVFGCGKIQQLGVGFGSFYFKMNAQTGALYWSKYETAGENYFSCMRYANGKYFLTGGAYGSFPDYYGRVVAVSSQTGQIIWQTQKIKGFYGVSDPLFRTMFQSSTEMVNGKMYITGELTNAGTTTYPILMGITENGVIFLQKILNLPNAGMGLCDYVGVRIELDQDQNLILAVNNSVFSNASWNLYASFIKCDPLGNIIFAKYYPFPVNYYNLTNGLNETPNSYVMYGFFASMNTFDQRLFALKISKTGSFEKCISIDKPNVSYFPAISVNYGIGNSTFLNGKHYFCATESATVPFNKDINQIILDEELNMIEDCSELNELTLTATDIPVTVLQMGITSVVLPLSLSNGITIEDQFIEEPCTNLSLDLVENPGCGASLVSANTAGFTQPTFYWSDGTVSTANTLSVSTTDTVFVRVLDTKCCELIDTIVPSIVPSSFTMSLPADTSVCLQPGNSFTITPVFSGANAPIQYLWNDNSTGASLVVTTSGTYWVDISDHCSTLRDSIVVTVNSLPVIGNTEDVLVCAGGFPVTLSPTISAGASVLWDDGTTSIDRSVNTIGNYTISATNLCGTTNAVIAVSQLDPPTVQLISSVDTCILAGNFVSLIPVLTGAPTISWSDGSTGSSLNVSTSGNYMVYASNVCGVDSAKSSVLIRYYPELNLPVVLDTCFEIGVGFSYTAQGSPGLYQWSSGSQTATEWISQEGIYACTLTNQCGSITDSMQVRRLSEISLYFPEDSIKDCQKQLSVSLLHIETNYNLEIFDPNGDLIGTQLSESGWYGIHAYNACNEKWDSIYVNLQNEQFFYLPNSFTPNGDDHNDRFEFKGENILIREIHIFNRWGEEVFKETGSFTGWDGKYQGQICPDGMYAVHLIYEDCFGMPTVFKGHVNLFR